MRFLFTIILLLCWLHVAAQVLIDKPLVLTGNGDAAKQVLGLSSAQEAEQALDAGNDQAGTAHWSGNAVGTVWAVDLPAVNGGLEAGLALVVRTEATQSGQVTLSVNGSAALPVLLAPGTPLLADHLPSGTMVALVFDGAAFQVTNGVAHQWRPCLDGSNQVSDHFCIEPNERPLLTWYLAAQTCVQAGMRLCTWSEWQRACQRRTELGLNDMVGNWEWTNNSANEDLSARMVGNLNCSSSSTRVVSDQLVFRCCYSR